MRRHLERARSWHEDIERGRVENAAALAARENCSRARVSQLLRLLDLVPAVLADLEDTEAMGPVPPERALRGLLRFAGSDEQLAAYRKLCTAVARQAKDKRPGASVHRRGLAHLFEMARRYERLLRDNEYGSFSEIGQAEGVSGARVAQIHLMLYLCDDIIEAVEGSPVSLPGVTEKELRRIARLKDADDQRLAFQALQDTGQE